ncbi:MAG: hypothetical protein QXH67_07280 [Candidatus Bathyarchaeia archaeon]
MTGDAMTDTSIYTEILCGEVSNSLLREIHKCGGYPYREGFVGEDGLWGSPVKPCLGVSVGDGCPEAQLPY